MARAVGWIGSAAGLWAAEGVGASAGKGATTTERKSQGGKNELQDVGPRGVGLLIEGVGLRHAQE
jgi:hypothetical protein